MTFFNTSSSRTFFHTHTGFFIFIISFAIVLIPKLLSPGFNTSDDPYYHAAHARAYWQNDYIVYPILSPYQQYPDADPWYGYHMLMAPFTVLFSGNNYETLIVSVQIFHALLTALLFLAFYIVAKKYFCFVRTLHSSWFESIFPKIPYGEAVLSPKILALICIGALVFLGDGFFDRVAIQERPHTLIIALTLLSFWAIFERRYFILFTLAILGALSYSFSLFVLIPSLALICAWIMLDRSKHNITFSILPLISSSAGIIMGIVLHPNSIGYIYNGIYIHLFSLYHSLFGWLNPILSSISTPQEMTPLLNSPSPFLLITTFSLVVALTLRVKQSFRIRKTVIVSQADLIETTAIIIGASFTIMMVYMPRSIEYAAPFVMLAICAIIFQYLIPIIYYYHKKVLSRIGEIGDLYRLIANGFNDVLKDARLIKGLKVICIISVLIFPFAMSTSSLVLYKHEHYQYRGVAEFMNTIGNSILYSPHYSDYTQLIFYGPHNQYATGIDSRFMYLYNPELERYASSVWKMNRDCTLYYCPPDQNDYYQFDDVLRQHNVTHVLLNEKKYPEVLRNRVVSNPGFALVYTDIKYPYIKVFEILHSN